MASSQSEEIEQRQRRGLLIKKSLMKEADKYQDNEIINSDHEDIDFSQEIHPLSYFINDREQMIEEVFSIIKGDTLNKMLPSSLKNCSVEELKADCSVHLLGMSKKRILAILEDKNLNSSSESESEKGSVELSINDESPISSNTNLKSNSNPGSIDLNSCNNSVKRKSCSNEIENVLSIILSDDSEDNQVIKKGKIKKEKRLRKSKVLKEKESCKSEANEEQLDEVNENSGKSLLEILELEMRARAIRALLKNTPGADETADSPPEEITETKKQIECVIDSALAEVDKSCDNDVEIQEVCPETVVIDDDEHENFDKQKKIECKSYEPNTTTGEMQEEICNLSEVPPEDVEIIFISDNESPAEENEAKSEKKANQTWSERWTESKKVKDVLTNSKLCANIRKRMRFAKMLEQKHKREQGKSNENSTSNDILDELNSVEESSVAQFNLLKSLDKPNQCQFITETSNLDIINENKSESFEADNIHVLSGTREMT